MYVNKLRIKEYQVAFRFDEVNVHDHTLLFLMLNAFHNFYFYFYKNLKILKISVLKKMIVLKNLNAVVKSI